MEVLSTVDTQEHAARRERLGITSTPKVIRRSTIGVEAPKPVLIEEDIKRRRVRKKPRDWLYITEIKPLSAPMRMQITRDILQTTSFKHGVTEEEILGSRRDVNTVRARHECFYRLSKEVGYSLPKIGLIMGGRDHTTILHGIRKHEARLLDAQE